MKKLLVGLMLIAPVGLVANNKCKIIRITQADIGVTGFVTSGPGRYILCEDITFGTDGEAAITLADDNVQLFLMNHSIELTSANATGIRIKKADDLTITEVLVDNDAIENTSAIGSQTGTGIEINKAQKVALLNICTMKNNIGLKITDSCDVYAHKCSFIEARTEGCFVKNSSSFTFERCVFNDNLTSLRIEGASKDGKILGCTFPNVQPDGDHLFVRGIEGLLIKNTLFTAISGSFSDLLSFISFVQSEPVSNVRLECCTLTRKTLGAQLMSVSGLNGLIIDSCLLESLDPNSTAPLINLVTTNSTIIRGSTFTGASSIDVGIDYTSGNTNALIHDSIVQKCKKGIVLNDSALAVVSSTVSENTEIGIEVKGTHNVISDCLITKNGNDGDDDAGIKLNGKFHVIKNSTVCANKKNGILITDDSNTIVNNDVLGNGTIGIDARLGADLNLVQRNRVHNNGTAGINDSGSMNQVLSNVASKNPTAATNYTPVAIGALPGAPTLTGQNISSSP